jgi:hypothetical protein
VGLARGTAGREENPSASEKFAGLPVLTWKLTVKLMVGFLFVLTSPTSIGIIFDNCLRKPFA